MCGRQHSFMRAPYQRFRPFVVVVVGETVSVSDLKVRALFCGISLGRFVWLCGFVYKHILAVFIVCLYLH